MSSMASCTKAEFVKADSLFENFASDSISINGKMHPSSMIWRMVLLIFAVFCQKFAFFF